MSLSHPSRAVRWMAGALFLAALATGAAAPAAADLLQCKWQVSGNTPDKTELSVEQDAGGVVYTVKNLKDNRAETFPHATINLGGARDWRGYRTLKCRMRLTSDAPTVMAGGKDLAFCFYDGKTKSEMLGVTSQQGLSYHLKGGDWQDFTLNLRTLGRSEIFAVDLYSYIAPYGITHQYKIEIARFELVQDDRPLFDGKGMSGPLPSGGGEPLRTLAAGEGLRVQVAKNGSVTGLAVGGQEIGGGTQPGGFLVRDTASEAPPVMAGGAVTVEDGAVVQHAKLNPLGLALDSRYRTEGNLVHVSLHAVNLTQETRFLTLYFALPLQKKAWSWGQDINLSEAIPADSERPYEESTGQYPLATLTAPEAGIALAIPLDQPRNYRLAYSEQTGLFYAAFDVALADRKTAAGQSLNEATCEVYLYPVDPQWGFRAALQAYYAAFPQWFAKRTQRDGGWEVGHGQMPPEDVIASGCRFNWGTGSDEQAAWNTKNGVLNTIYIEPEYIQISMTDLKPSDEAALTRLKNLTAGSAAEWKKMEPLHYTQAGKDDPYAAQHGLQAYHQMLAQAALVSGLVGADGRPVLGVGYRGDWIGENGLGMMVPCNLDPLIPHGRGQVALELLEASAQARVDKKLTIDGWALDSFVCDDTYDYRAENFAYAPFPLTFEQDHVQPAVPNRLTLAAWVKELAARGAPTGKVIFGNLAGNITFSAPYLDIFGTESGSVGDPAYHRSMAYHRAVTYLPYTPKPDLDVFFNLLYGVYPGRGLVQAQYNAMVPVLDQITAAGWEPVTWAKTNAPHVRVERFGSGDHCYLVFHNNDPAARTFQATVDTAALQTKFQKATVLFGPQKGQAVAASAGAFPLQLGSRETAVVKLD